jgi:glycosyltransferase involved in cell wall biosynthesis
MDSKKIKVCYILPKFDLNIDTHFFHLYYFINLAAKYCDLSLIIESSKSDLSFFKDAKNIYVQRFSWPLFRFFENLFLVILMRLKGYNIFYIHYSYISAFNAGLISRVTGAKSFYWNCGLAWKYKRDRALAIVLKMVNYLVTGVEVLKKGYSENYNISQDKIKIMPNWVDSERFSDVSTDDIYEKYNLEKNKIYILFIHHLSERKGAHYIVDVAKEFIGQANVEFLVAGDGPYKEKLEENIKKENLQNVKLLGKVPNKIVQILMKVSKIFFMPSEEEGFPRVLLEAMISGLPYVASDVGGVREISTKEQQDFIYNIGDIKGMISGIKKLLDDNSLYEELKRVNLENVKRFDIKEVVQIFVNKILIN